MTMSSLRNGATISPEVWSFFRAIKENPDDDTPRLIFADWLQERGDAASAARGDYLRLAVLRHRLPPDDPSYELIKRREAEIFTEHRWTWLGPLSDATRRWTFYRGMIQVTAEAERLLMTTPEIDEWARSEPALWVDSLTLTDLGHRHAKPLLSFPLLSNLETLDLNSNFFLSSCLRSFLGKLNADHMPYLSYFYLNSNDLTAYPLIPLLRRRFPRLRVLDLQHNHLTDSCAQTLVEAPLFGDGVELLVGGNRFTEEGIELLRRAFGDRVQF